MDKKNKDKELVLTSLQPTLINTYDQLPGVWCKVNKLSKFVYANESYAKLVGVAPKSRLNLVGKTVADIPCKASECAPLFWKEDQTVLEKKRNVRFINIIQLANNEWKLIELLKSPTFDIDGNLQGILFQITDHTEKRILELGSLLVKTQLIRKTKQSQDSFIINETSDNINLKPKESECLFFMLRGYTSKRISEIQKVSQRTIIDHIERLKFKFNCLSKSELISKAIELGYLNYIPQSMFNEQLSILLKD